jgi:hypothetical protein
MTWPYYEDRNLFKIRYPRLTNDIHLIVPEAGFYTTNIETTRGISVYTSWTPVEENAAYREFLRRFVSFRQRPFPITNERLYQFLQEQFYLAYQRDQDILQKLETILLMRSSHS